MLLFIKCGILAHVFLKAVGFFDEKLISVEPQRIRAFTIDCPRLPQTVQDARTQRKTVFMLFHYMVKQAYGRSERYGWFFLGKDFVKQYGNKWSSLLGLYWGILAHGRFCAATILGNIP